MHKLIAIDGTAVILMYVILVIQIIFLVTVVTAHAMVLMVQIVHLTFITVTMFVVRLDREEHRRQAVEVAVEPAAATMPLSIVREDMKNHQILSIPAVSQTASFCATSPIPTILPPTPITPWEVPRG